MKSFVEIIEPISRWAALTEQEKRDCCINIISRFEAESSNESAIAELASALASSGSKYEWPADISPLASVISTGGTSSLSTLLCPFIIASTGCYVPNLTVPGSVAGALDVLALLRGYNGNLSQKEMVYALRTSRVANTLTSSEFAPADGYLFMIRKSLSKKNLCPLVIASLLAKKIASSNYSCVVDIRCGTSGNFGRIQTECRKNAELFIRVARLLKIQAICVVTDIRQPLMPFIGRIESLQALYLILSDQNTNPWLMGHLETCQEIASQAILASRYIADEGQVKKAVSTACEIGELNHIVELNLKSQGSSIKELEDILNNDNRRKRYITSSESGYIEHIDCGRLSMSLIKANSPDFPSGGNIGLVCLKKPGDKVESNEPIIELRCPSSFSLQLLDEIVSDMSSAYRIGTGGVNGLPNQIMDIIG